MTLAPEQRSEQVERRFEHELVAVLSQAASADDATSGVLELIARRRSWALAILWVADSDLLRVAGSWSDGDAEAGEFARVTSRLTFGPGIGLPGRVWESSESLWVADVTGDDQFPRRTVAGDAGIRTGAGAPVTTTRETIGVVEVFARDSRPRDDGALAELEIAGRQVGHYLARVTAEERLRESEERTGQITRAALDCIITMDHEGLVLDVNPAAEATFGIAREEAIGRELAELIIPPELRDAHRAALTRYVESGAPTILDRRLELDSQRPDGTRFPVELTVTRLGRRDPPVFAGFLRDITDRRNDEVARAELLELERGARLRAEQAERRAREIADVLQRSLLPPKLPEIPQLELGAAYRPGAAGVQVGGDFYDVFELPGGDWGLIIGDVRGKGVEAASVTALVRYTARAAAVRASSSSAVLRTVNDVILSNGSDEELCTAIFGRLRAGSSVSFALSIGGHPLPVLLRADGEAQLVGTAGTLLGVEQHASLADTEVVLEPGDALVMVTDGVQDLPTADGRLGEQGLLEIVRSCRGMSAAAIAARIDQVAAAAPDGADDVAVLVVRAPPAG